MLNSLTAHNIPLDDISFFFQKDIQVKVLRLDQLHPVISGNKWFKLRFYLEEVISKQKKGLITFGGAWSNHIAATAAACESQGIRSIGLIRGEEPALYSPTLLQAKQAGMQLRFLSRSDYKEKKIPQDIAPHGYLIVPEGGYGQTGADGASTILAPEIIPDPSFSHIICAAGTGTMTAGLINAAPADTEILAVSVLKNNLDLPQAIAALLRRSAARWNILHDYSLGGYARHTPELIGFMNFFFEKTRIPSDFVYTGKLFYALADLIKNNNFKSQSRLLVIHSGGLQGNRSLPKGTLMF